MKLMGTKRGFHDLVFFHPVPPKNGLAIEMKLEGRRLTQEQKEWIPILSHCGFAVVPCWGYEAAREAFTDYLRGKFHD
jgi:hypothetical protein